MSFWQAFSGSERLRSVLSRTLAGNRLPHSYVIGGGTVQDRENAIIAIAAGLNCETAAAPDACGTCTSCHKIAQHLHPDVQALVPTGASQQISIETVREMITRLARLPNEARLRVIYTIEATGLFGPAANALLKTLEEPPQRTLFLLATAAPEQLLPTIRSRCQTLRLGDGEHAALNPQASALAARVLAAMQDSSDLHSLAAELTAEKGAHLATIAAVAQALGARARQLAAAQDPSMRRYAHAAQHALGWHFSMRVHNAHPVLATEALLAELRDLRE